MYLDKCIAFPPLFSIITSPLRGSGLLTTAVSTTAGCSIRALSTSNGPMRYLGKEK